jgi:hypothetical protein
VRAGGAHVAALVVAGPAGHHLLRVATRDLGDELRPRSTQHRSPLAVVGDDDVAAALDVVGEPGRLAWHWAIVAGVGCTSHRGFVTGLRPSSTTGDHPTSSFLNHRRPPDLVPAEPPATTRWLRKAR